MRRRGIPPLYAFIACVAALYLGTLSVNHTEAEDSLHYLSWISYGPLQEQFHPNHLLYGFVNYAWFHLWKAFGYQGHAELPVKLLNVMAGIVVLVLMLRVARRLKLPPLLSWVATAGTAFSFGFWWYSVECETYILPLVFVLLAIDRMARIAAGRGQHALLGLFVAAAILFHQQHVLLIPVLLAGYGHLSADHGARPGWRRLRAMATFVGTVAAVVLVTYVAVGLVVFHHQSLAAFTKWMGGRALEDTWGYWKRTALFEGGLGFTHALVGGHYLFSFAGVANALRSRMPTAVLTEEIFLVRDFPPLAAAGLVVLAIISIALAAFVLTSVIRRGGWRWLIGSRDGAGGPEPVMRRVLAGYVIAYTVFAFWWEPRNAEFWIPLIPGLLLLLASWLEAVRPGKRAVDAAVLAVALLIPQNLFGSVLPQLRREGDYWYQFNRWLIANAKPGDLVVSGSGRLADAWVLLSARAEVFSVLHASGRLEEDFSSLVAHQKPRRILVSSTVRSPAPELIRRKKIDPADTRRFFDALSPGLETIHADHWQEIYVYHQPLEPGFPLP